MGICGLDGDELLLSAQEKFGFRFPTEPAEVQRVFEIQPDETLFSDEPHLLSWLFAVLRPNRRASEITVARLHRAIARCMRPNNSLERSRGR